jgi:hypothetical protein
MAFISIYDGDGNYVGEAYIGVPTHLGRLFVPRDVGKKIAAEGASFSLNIQFRTNDNNNRRYSNPFPFP